VREEEFLEYIANNMLFNLIPAIWFLAEAISMLTNKKRRAIHDYIAGTVVVRISTAEVAPHTAITPSTEISA